MLRSLTPRIALVLALAACTESGLAQSDDRSDSGESETGNESDTDTAPGLPDATWARLSGQLALVDGAVDIAGSSLAWSFYDASLTSVCAYAAPIATASELTPPDPSVYGWWSVSTDDTDDDGSCAYARPAELELGLGAVDPQLYPAMANADVDDSASPYGLYAKVGWDAIDEDTPLWVFGIAGTDGAFDGSEPAVSEAPLPDGVYTLEPLHLFSVP